jgi:TonB family protein
MVAGAQTRVWAGPSRRRVPRYRVQAPIDVTVLRSGIPDTVPGRSVNVCERGIAAVLAGEVVPGEAVGIEVRLPLAQDSLRTRAMVKYQHKLHCGLEFVGLSAEQRAAIRDWMKEAKLEAVTEAPVAATAVTERTERSSDAGGGNHPATGATASGGSGSGGPYSGKSGKKKRRWVAWSVFLVLLAITAAMFWWKWTRGWEELESGLKGEASASAEKVQAQVPAEVMEKLLVHRVEPVYPAEARQANLEGIIALDIVVGRDGSVVSMRALNGPEVLARAAMNALRWWKFEPYRLNGQAAVVETTVAVEFKR